MRQIILDTETTGLDPLQGHRIIEIGCLELVNRKLTGNKFHCYLNPQRTIDTGALAVHGLTNEFLKNKPIFANIVTQFIEFIKGAELIIHNAPFDVGFIDYELKLIGKEFGLLNDYCTVIDTLTLARQLHPGQKNSLDALCKRYKVDNSQRDLHGALLDANLLALVYLYMTSGQSQLFATPTMSHDQHSIIVNTASVGTSEPLDLPVILANEAELIAHEKRLKDIGSVSGEQCIWLATE